MTVASGGSGIVVSGGAPASPAARRPRDVVDLADAVASAATARQPLRITAGGTWLDAGRSVVPGALALDLSALNGIVEYVPGDLTLTALAGTPLAAIASATAANEQWLSLDPFGSADGTLGATLATASAGPLAASLGQPRDAALGIEFVSGTGERVRGGGRVVKNVAGFDFVRMQVGAWGTLGVIAEATVRLRGLPEVDRTIAVRVQHAPGAVAGTIARLRAQRVTPLAAELLDPKLSQALGLGAATVLLVRLAGNEDAVAAQHRLVETLGDSAVVPTVTWQGLATIEPPTATVLRLPGLPSQVAATWLRATALVDTSSMMHASLGRGTVRVISVTGDSARLASAALTGGRCIIERVPPDAQHLMPPIATDRLSSRLRAAFDPHGILNPGIFGR